VAEEWQPSAELRLVAAFASLDWSRASLSRAVEHLREVDRPSLEPLADELLAISNCLAGLQRLVQAAYEAEREGGSR
jgi:hypothetical protein